LPKGILTPSFIEMALAVAKRALLADGDDGHHVELKNVSLASGIWRICINVRNMENSPIDGDAQTYL
jgi:hypothetical protein